MTDSLFPADNGCYSLVLCGQQPARAKFPSVTYIRTSRRCLLNMNASRTHHKWNTGLFLSHELFMILMHLKCEGHGTRICVLILNHRRERLRGLTKHTHWSLVIYGEKGAESQYVSVTGAHICSRTPSSQTGIMFTKVTSAPKQPESWRMDSGMLP